MTLRYINPPTLPQPTGYPHVVVATGAPGQGNGYAQGASARGRAAASPRGGEGTTTMVMEAPVRTKVRLRRKTRILWPLGVGVGVLVLGAFVGAHVWAAAQTAARAPAFWWAKAGESVAADAIRLVALGDSTAEAIGADHPMEGFVGRIATYVQARTGRTVHIVNVADGGATCGEIARRQLPRVDLATADLVIVASSSDVERRTPLDSYRVGLDALLPALPADKTVISDVPLLPGREPYQGVLQERADVYGIARADFARIFSHEGRRLDIFSWLPPHLNSKGYVYWFLAFKPAVDQILPRITAASR
jgi:lysophospholipase L1-like esterase